MRKKILLTSNINLLETNNVWENNTIKQNIFFDKYNKILISLNDRKILSKFDNFICIIYLNEYLDNNFKKIFGQLENTFLKNINKKITLFLFLEKTNNFKIDKENLKNSNIFINKMLELCSDNFKLILKIDEKKEVYNTRNKFLLKCPFSTDGLNTISTKINKIIEEKIIKPFKLIILDCDNTLWGGIIGEDGIENLKYSEDGEGIIFEKIQKHFKELKKMGFMLSLCSKNNSKEVWKTLKLRNMHLKKTDFLFSKINWLEKTINIENILNEFSLREEDVLFVDDSKLEVNKVKKKFQNISTLLVNDLSKYYEDILINKRLQKFGVFIEDHKKHRQYKLKKKYQDFKKKTNFSDIFFELNQKIKFLDINKSNIARAEQLFNKTNQFNFTTNRHDKLELLKIVNSKNSFIKLVSLQDKFGDHGIIGCFSYQKIGNEIFINDFILSCRILFRKIEEYILYKIKKKFKKNNVYLKYIKNNQNKELVSTFIKKNYFKSIKLKKIKPNHFLYKIFNTRELNEIKKFF